MIDQAARGKKISISSSARLVVGIVAASGLLGELEDIGRATWRRNGRIVFTRSMGIGMAPQRHSLINQNAGAAG